MENENEFQVTIRQKDPSFEGRRQNPDDGYLWGLCFSPEFSVEDVHFHANTNLEIKGFVIPRVDILEFIGEEPQEKLQVVLSKSLIANYTKELNAHEFILKGNEEITRLDELIFVNTKELPEELAKKLE